MLGFILPMILILSLISYIHYKRERRDLESLTEASAIQLSNIMLDGLNHAMMANDMGMIVDVMDNVGEDPAIENVWIITSDAIVYTSTDPSKVGVKLDLNDSGCIECHQYPVSERPHALHLWLEGDFLRVTTLIPNEPECHTCHPSSQANLGVFHVDLSTAEINKHLQENMMNNIIFSALSILSLMLVAYFLVHWLIVRRVDVIRHALLRLGSPDFSTRINTRWHTSDEITQLADNINNMAANLEVLQIEHEQKDRIRVQAIIEERERIARELHDGVAQFLGYLSTKIGAIRLALKNQKRGIAEINLEQVEESIRDQSIEVRSAIIGLKMAGSVDSGFAANVREFVDQCNRLNDLLTLELEISNDVDVLSMDAEKELQLFRILQEAVSNIRKHSQASEAMIRLEKNETQLTMIISDNGVGFNPVQIGLEREGHFGLQIMFERAHAIDAHIEIKSNPGSTTQIIVAMDLQESLK